MPLNKIPDGDAAEQMVVDRTTYRATPRPPMSGEREENYRLGALPTFQRRRHDRSVRSAAPTPSIAEVERTESPASRATGPSHTTMDFAASANAKMKLQNTSYREASR